MDLKKLKALADSLASYIKSTPEEGEEKRIVKKTVITKHPKFSKIRPRVQKYHF